MSVAFEDSQMWFKFALSLVSSHKYAKAILVLQECAKIDPDSYIYHSLIARVALQNIREPNLAIESLDKALEIAEKSKDVTCYETAKIHLLMAIAHAIQAEMSIVNNFEKHAAWELARKKFAKLFCYHLN